MRQVGAPTFAVVSVRLLSVVDLPDDGLPTSAMRGSRGILTDLRWEDDDLSSRCSCVGYYTALCVSS